MQPSVSNKTCRHAWVRYSIPVCMLPKFLYILLHFCAHWLKKITKLLVHLYIDLKLQLWRSPLLKDQCPFGGQTMVLQHGPVRWGWLTASERGPLSVIGCHLCFDRWFALHFLKRQFKYCILNLFHLALWTQTLCSSPLPRHYQWYHSIVMHVHLCLLWAICVNNYFKERNSHVHTMLV